VAAELLQLKTGSQILRTAITADSDSDTEVMGCRNCVSKSSVKSSPKNKKRIICDHEQSLPDNHATAYFPGIAGSFLFGWRSLHGKRMALMIRPHKG